MSQTPHAPEVHGRAMCCFTVDNFGSDVIRSAAERPPLALLDGRGDAEITQLRFMIVIEQNVRQFYVAVDDVFRVEVLEALQDSSQISLGFFVC